MDILVGVSLELERENKYQISGNSLKDLMQMADLGQLMEKSGFGDLVDLPQ